jgi:predicted nuclease of predicted toxin-antitoxin system
MRFKLDENLPTELASDLAVAGQQAETVVTEGLAGAADSDLLEAACREDRILLTLDQGIANVHRYPPGAYAGIVLLRPDSMGRGAVLRFVRQHLPEVLALELKGRLVVVTGRAIRVR